MSAVIPTHIQLDDRGIAWIDDTNVKVIEVVLENRRRPGRGGRGEGDDGDDVSSASHVPGG